MGPRQMNRYVPHGLIRAGSRSVRAGAGSSPARAAACLLVAACVLIARPTPGAAQDQRSVRGVVIEAIRDVPIVGAEVRIVPDGPAAVTGADGVFEFRVPTGTVVELEVSSIGYTPGSATVPAGRDDVDLQLVLRAAPFELDSLQVTVMSYEERLEAVERHLESRMDRLGGQYRSAGREVLQQFEAGHDSDPWRFLTESLDASWGGRPESVWIFARRVRPQVYIDEDRRWFFQLLAQRPGSLCRLEIYVPPRRTIRLDEAPTQIRAYTCSFLARVIAGEVTLSRYLLEKLGAVGPPSPFR